MAVKNIKGITIEIDGNVAPLEKALKSVNTTLRTTQKDLTDINKLLKVDPTNVELLKQKQEALGNAIAATKEKLDKEKQALEQLKKQPQTEEVIDQQTRLSREIVETEQKLQKLEKDYKSFGSVARQQVQAVANKIGEMGTKVSEVGQKISGMGDKMTTAVTLPIVAAGTAATKSFAEVDKTMQLVNKTMGNTTEEAQMLNDAMSAAAANSTFGMNDAATATLNFARAGLSASDAAAALAPAMNLAAGEGGNLETVSAGLVATINGFGDSFDQTSKYADIFAAACNNSALDVDSLSQAMSIAAPIFKAAGYSIEDAALYMGVMANAGIDANTAATALKTGLARLAKPAKDGAEAMKKYGIEVFNADGTMKDSITVQKELHKAFAGMTEQEQLAAAAAIFGKNQMSNWLALINTAPDKVDKLSESLNTAAGTTEEMADAMMSGFGGSIEKSKSSLDVLMTSLGGLIAEYITPLVGKIQAAVDEFIAMDKEEQQQIVRIAALVAVLGPLLSIGGRIVTGIGVLMETVPKITDAIMAMNPEIAAVVAVVGLMVAAYVGLEVAMRNMEEENQKLADGMAYLNDEQKKLIESAKDVAEATKKSADARKTDRDNMTAQKNVVSKLVTELRSYVDENGRVISSSDRVKEIVAELNTIMGDLNLVYDEQTQSISMTADEVERYTEALLRQAEVEAIQTQLTQIMQERIQVETELAKIQDEYNAAVEEYGQALNEAKQFQEDYNNGLINTTGAVVGANEAYRGIGDAMSEADHNTRAIFSTFGDLTNRLEELNTEENFLVDQIGSTNAAMGEQGNAAQVLADAVDGATDEISSSWEEVEKAVSKSVSSQISLFDEYKKQQEENKTTMIKNAEEQVKALESWSTNLQELSKKGISEGLLQELAKMGPEGAAKVAAFNQMTEPELARASQLFDEAVKIPAETIANVEKNYAELGQKEHDAYTQAVENGVSVTRQKTINSWEQVGDGVPTGVIQAIKQEEGNVKKTISEMDKLMVDTAKEELQINSPSKVFEGIGQGIDEGLVLGVSGKLGEVRRVATEVVRACADTVREGLDVGVFHAIGNATGQALADGLLAMLPAVEAAANRLIQAAQRAGQAAGSVGAGGGTSGAGVGTSNAMTTMANTMSAATPTTNTTNNTTNLGGVTIPVYAAAGQDVNEIAAAVEDILMVQINRTEGAFA